MSCRHHVVYHGFGQVKHRIQIGVDHVLPLLYRHFFQGAVFGDACIVDQHTDVAAKVFFDVGHQGLRVVKIGDVTLIGFGFYAQVFQLLDPSLIATRTHERADDHIASLPQLGTNFLPDTAQTTCYQCDFFCHSPLSSILSLL